MNLRKTGRRIVFLFPICFLVALVGCNAKSKNPTEQKTRLADAQAVVVEKKEDLSNHVGDLVTLKGKISNQKIGPLLLGVLVRADSSFEGKVVTATGMLTKTSLDPPGKNNNEISFDGSNLDLPVPANVPRFKFQLTPADGDHSYPIQVEIYPESGQQDEPK